MFSSIENYIEAWNTLDEMIRLEKLNLSFSKDGRYLDPHLPSEIKNLNEMNLLIKKF